MQRRRYMGQSNLKRPCVCAGVAVACTFLDANYKKYSGRRLWSVWYVPVTLQRSTDDRAN